MRINCLSFFFIAFGAMLFASSCRDNHPAKEPVIVKTPEQMDKEVAANIKAVLQYANDNAGKINDSIALSYSELVADYYKKSDYKNIWSQREEQNPLADSLLQFINQSKY